VCVREGERAREGAPPYPSVASPGLTVRLWINHNPKDCQIIGESLSSKLEDNRYPQVDMPGLQYKFVIFRAGRAQAHRIGELK
jgi:hypothetical protein